MDYDNLIKSLKIVEEHCECENHKSMAATIRDSINILNSYSFHRSTHHISSQTKPPWWPQNPYPEDVFPMTVDEYVKAIPNKKLRTAISGCNGRFFWDVASKMIWHNLIDYLEDLETKPSPT